MAEFLRRTLDDAAFFGGRFVSSVSHNASLVVLSLALSLSVWLYVNDSQNPRQTDFVPGSIPVDVVNVPNGRAVLPLANDTVSVRVSAPKNVFDGLTAQDLSASIDLSGVNADQATLPVRVKSSKRQVQVVEVSPSTLEVTLDNLVSRTVPVQVAPLGVVPVGFDLTSTSSDPTSVVISGPQSLAQQVAAACAEVNLTDLRVSVQQTVRLKAQGSHCGDISAVSFSPEDVRVTVDVSQTVFTRPFVVTPTVRGQPAAGYSIAAISVDPPLVQVSAPLDILSSIDPVKGLTTEEVNIAGARGGDSGSQAVTRVVKIQLPQGATASAQDVTVQVTIAAQQGQMQFALVPLVRNLGAGLRATLALDAVRVILSGPLPVLTALDPSTLRASVDVSGLGPGLYLVNVTVDPPSGLNVVTIDPSPAGVAISQQ